MKKHIHILLFCFVIILCLLTLSGAEKEADYYKIAEKMGFEDVEKQPFEIAEIVLPEKFNKVYLNYNELLKKSGYDLSLYKGKKCIRYTYNIPSVNARLNVLVCGGKVIGGDISSITLDGIMIPIIKVSNAEEINYEA